MLNLMLSCRLIADIHRVSELDPGLVTGLDLSPLSQSGMPHEWCEGDIGSKELQMNVKRPLRVADLIMIAMGPLLLGVSASRIAFAQTSAPEQAVTSEETEEVIIHSPYIAHQQPAPRGTAPSDFRNPELITLSRHISYHDLDLSTPSGVAVLQARIRNTAKEVCDELTRRYPKSNQYVYPNTDCVKKATDDAMEAFEQITAVASR